VATADLGSKQHSNGYMKALDCVPHFALLGPKLLLKAKEFD
jgi:hypothetical protein